MSIKQLLKKLDDVAQHPQTPYFVIDHKLAVDKILVEGVGVSKDYKDLVSDAVKQVDVELRNEFRQIDQTVVNALKRNGYNVKVSPAGTPGTRAEIVYPGNRMRIAL